MNEDKFQPYLKFNCSEEQTKQILNSLMKKILQESEKESKHNDKKENHPE